MKEIAAALTAFFLLFFAGSASAYNVFAPNSFEAAGENTWEYRAVVRMCSEEKSPGYPPAYFEGRTGMSRYELAGVMIDLMDNGRDLTDADREELGKMTKSYRRELAAHGWKGPHKEKKKPIIEIHGDLRARYRSGEGTDGRARVGFSVPVGDHTTISAGKEKEFD